MPKESSREKIIGAALKTYFSRERIGNLIRALDAVQRVQNINGEGYVSLYGTTPIMEELVDLGVLASKVKTVSENYSVVIYRVK